MLAAAKAEAAASALEQAADSFIQERIKWLKEAGLAATQEKELGCSCYGTDKENSHASGCARHIAAKIHSLSPIPNAKALWEAKVELRQSKEIYMATQASHNPALITYFEKHIAKLESAVAKLREEREEK